MCRLPPILQNPNPLQAERQQEERTRDHCPRLGNRCEEDVTQGDVVSVIGEVPWEESHSSALRSGTIGQLPKLPIVQAAICGQRMLHLLKPALDFFDLERLRDHLAAKRDGTGHLFTLTGA
jgi:hypothetical protein